MPWSVFCALVLLLCLIRPHAGRVFVGVFFLIMAVAVNVVLVLVAPEQFVALGTDTAIPATRLIYYDHEYEQGVSRRLRALELG